MNHKIKVIVELFLFLFGNLLVPTLQTKIKKIIPDKKISYSGEHIFLPSHQMRGINHFKKLKGYNLKEKQAKNKTKKAIVLGASSGMGRQIAKILAKNGYEVGLSGRRVHLLESLQKEIKTKSYIKKIDVTHIEEVEAGLAELINNLGGLDLMFISVGGFGNNTAKNEFEFNKNLIAVDVQGFFYVCEIALNFFEQQGYGHLAGISSIDSVRGSAKCPVYCGVKAFAAKYLEGLRNRMIQNKMPITITEIVPGWVDNENIKFSEMPETYWVAKTQDAAAQIYKAIENKEKRVVVTGIWNIIDILLKIMPDWLYNKIGGL